MNKNENLADLPFFYSEIPVGKQPDHPDYFYRDTRITHAYDKPRNPALSQAQLSALAKELLTKARKEQRAANLNTDQLK